MVSQTLMTGLIGPAAQHSLRPMVFARLGGRLGLAFEQLPIDTNDRAFEGLSRTVHALREQGFLGCTVDGALQGEVGALCDVMSPIAQSIGLADTIVFDEAGLVGDNAAYVGFVSAWRAEHGDRLPGRVLLAGTGVHARALAFALLELGARELIVHGAPRGGAKALVADLVAAGAEARAVTARGLPAAARAADGWVDAGEGLDLDPEALVATQWVCDLRTGPGPLNAAATVLGATVLGGTTLRVHEAVEAFAWFVGKRVRRPAMLAHVPALAVQVSGSSGEMANQLGGTV